MSNFLKIPVNTYSEHLVTLINELIKRSPDWDKQTLVSSIKESGESITMTFIKSSGSIPTENEKRKIGDLVTKLGLVYEYNT